MIRHLMLLRSWWLYQRALAKYESAERFRIDAINEAAEADALERASTVMRLEATTS